MLPGEVRSDEQAFRQIFGRLEGEVGMSLRLILGNAKGDINNIERTDKRGQDKRGHN
jgi:hypothetical protein